jgi:hypothetical protein
MEKVARIINKAEAVYGPDTEFNLLVLPTVPITRGETDMSWMNSFYTLLSPSVKIIDLTKALTPDMFFEHDQHLNVTGYQFMVKAILDTINSEALDLHTHL